MAVAIFRDSHQAIKFAYLIQSYEVGAESAMAVVLRRALEEMGLKDGTREASSVNFGGLNALEVRGQCAIIRGMVNDQLPKPEALAVKSVYGYTRDVAKKGEPRRYVYAAERQDAMLGLAQYLAGTMRLPMQAVIWLVVRACAERKEVRPTFEQISEQVGIPLTTLAVAYKPMQANIKRLENMGMARLELLFKDEGIIPSEVFE